jgi:hypothetical protein
LVKIFGIETGFMGSIVSNLAKMKFEEVTAEVNDKHLKPWSDLTKVRREREERV